MKVLFRYNPSLYKLGRALMDVSMTTAIGFNMADYKWTGLVLMGCGMLGRLLMALYGREVKE